MARLIVFKLLFFFSIVHAGKISSTGPKSPYTSKNLITIQQPNSTPGDYDSLLFETVCDTCYPRISFAGNGLKLYSTKGLVQWTLTYEGRIYSPRGVSAGSITTYDYNGILTNNNGELRFKVDPALTTQPYAHLTSEIDVVHSALLQITANKSTNRDLILKGAASQSANLAEARDSSDNVYWLVGANGLDSLPLFANGSFPIAGKEGDMFENSTDHVPCYWNGSAWKRFDGSTACH